MPAVRTFKPGNASVFGEGDHIGVGHTVNGLLPAPATGKPLPVCMALACAIVSVGDHEVMVVEIHSLQAHAPTCLGYLSGDVATQSNVHVIRDGGLAILVVRDDRDARIHELHHALCEHL